MKRSLILLLILLSQLAHAECPRPSMKEAAMLDIVSTLASVGEKARESNPLGLVGTTVLKGFVFYNEDSLDDSDKTIVSAIWTGAGVNNIMVLLGAAFYPAILLGIISGIIVTTYNDCTTEKTNVR